MLRRVTLRAAPVYCQIIDESRFEEHMTSCRRGVGFSVKIELGDGVKMLERKYFQRIIDDHMRSDVKSNLFNTTSQGNIFDKFGQPVTHVHAFEKYIVTGQMAAGYVKKDQKFGHRLSGMKGAKMRPGLRWAGEE